MSWARLRPYAIRSLFKTFGEAATYARLPAAAIPVTAIVNNATGELLGQWADALREGATIDLMVAEVPQKPKRGDIITVGATGYVIKTTTAEEHDLIWRVDVDQQ